MVNENVSFSDAAAVKDDRVKRSGVGQDNVLRPLCREQICSPVSEGIRITRQGDGWRDLDLFSEFLRYADDHCSGLWWIHFKAMGGGPYYSFCFRLGIRESQMAICKADTK